MTVACSRVSSMSVRAVITSYALVGPQGRTQNSVLVGAARCLPVAFTGTGTVLFKNTGTCGGSRDSHGTNIVHTAERDTPITRVRARLGRACADGACGRGCAVDSTGHALYWLLGGEPNGKTEGEAKADFMRWSSGAPCNNMATCDVQRASERRGAREVGGQMLSRNAAQTIDVLGFCRSAICRSS